ncbi:MAG: hypothetical protein O2856_14145, partial [Planctomycetota bacterium]|nr:hypothetical protein [Planctomycetota bacterium]
LILTGAGLRRAIFGEVQHADQEVSRTDIAVVALKDVVEGRFPDLCMVCGQHTTDRVTKTIQYQSKRAQAAMMMGFLLGGIPGVAIAILTSHETPVACPLCTRHSKHWNRLTLFASIGWLIPILAGGLGLLIGFLASNAGLAGPVQNNTAIIAGIPGLLLGLGTYLIPVIYMACTQVKCEQKSDDLVTFSRVSSAFARATRNPKS